jgi:hypothetical protein
MSLGEGLKSCDLSSTHAAARYSWQPDVDFIELSKLAKAPLGRESQIVLLGELSRLCLRSPCAHVAWIQPPSDHLKMYAKRLGSSLIVLTGKSSAKSEAHDVAQLLQDWIGRLQGTPAAAAVTVLERVFESLSAILIGDTTVDAHLSDDIQSALETFTSAFDLKTFVRQISRSDPTLRVLEIGNDTPIPSTAATQAL